jgi:hypothetical protein
MIQTPQAAGFCFCPLAPSARLFYTRKANDEADKHMSKKKRTPGAPVRHALKLKTNIGPIELDLLQTGSTFQVERIESLEEPEFQVGFEPKGPGVVNLDDYSDAMDVFGISTSIRVDRITLGSLEMRAHSIEELEAALKSVKFRRWNHEEI